MGWRDKLLRYLAGSAISEDRLDLQCVTRVLDRIDGDAELDRSLDALDGAHFIAEFRRLYEQEAERGPS